MKISSAFLVVSAVLSLPAWGAGSVDTGRALFTPYCGSCHEGDPTAARFVPARFNPGFLTQAFAVFMPFNLPPRFSTQDVNDMATYLGLVGLGLPNSNDTDRLLDWGEDTFPQLLSPRRQPTGQFLGYTYRFYPNTGFYIGTKDGNVWYFNGGPIGNLGTLRSFLDQMPNGR